MLRDKLLSGLRGSRKREEEALEGVRVRDVEIERLLDNPYQPRRRMEEEELQQLTQTIKSQGFQGVLVARPDPMQAGMYQITAGHRRREAARRAGLKALPVVVREFSDVEMATLAVTENIQRVGLSPLEEGRLFDVMVNKMGLTQVEVAHAIQKDRGYVRNRLRLAYAPQDVQAFAEAKQDSLRAVVYLLEVEDTEERGRLIEQLLQRTLLTNDLAAMLKKPKRVKKTRVEEVAMPKVATKEDEDEGEDEDEENRNRGERREQEIARRGEEVRSTMTESEVIMVAARARVLKLQEVLKALAEYRDMVFVPGMAPGTSMGITDQEIAVLEIINAMLRMFHWR